MWERHLWVGGPLSLAPTPPEEAMEARDTLQLPRRQPALTRIVRPLGPSGDMSGDFIVGEKLQTN